MDSFVINTLTEWQLTDLVERFKEEGIDEESFLLLDEATINQLIPRAGPRLKFFKKFRGLVEPAVGPAIPPTISDVTPTATPPNPMEEQAAAVVPFSQDVRQILTGLHDGKQIVEGLDEDNVITTSQRRLLVRILVSYLIEKFGEKKYGTPQDGATGQPFLEERLLNIRKRLRSTSRSWSTAQTPPQTPDDGALARALIPECTISDERASQLKEWLRNNSQPLSQIETYMQNTAVYRAKWIRDNNWTIDQILEEFPRLMTIVTQSGENGQ